MTIAAATRLRTALWSRTTIELQELLVQHTGRLKSFLIESLIDNLTEHEAEILLRSFDTAENLEGQLQRSICRQAGKEREV